MREGSVIPIGEDSVIPFGKGSVISLSGDSVITVASGFRLRAISSVASARLAVARRASPRAEAVSRTVLWALLALTLAIASSHAPHAQQPLASPKQRPPVFRSTLELVLVNVVVRDRKGEVVRGLKAEDFAIVEDGKPQEITSFDFEEVETPVTAAPSTPGAAPPPILKVAPVAAPAAAPAAPVAAPAAAVAAPAAAVAAPAAATAPSSPKIDLEGRRLVVLLFDLSSMQPEEIERAVTSARKYVDTQMVAADLVAIASVSQTLQIDQDFTSDKASLSRVFDRYAGIESAGFAEGVTPDVEATEAEPFVPDDSEFNIFNTDRRLQAIETLADALAPIQQKKSIIYFSSGVTRNGTDNQMQLRTTTDSAVKANVSIYPVDTRGLQALVPGGDATQASASGTAAFSGRSVQRQVDRQAASQDTLTSLAGDTGGRAFLDTNEFGEVYERVAADTSAYYILGFSSTNPARDGRFRRIRVRVNRPDLRIEHRAGYYAGKDWTHASRDDREQQLHEQLLSDLSPTDLPVWLSASYFRLADNRFYVPVSVAVPGSAVPFQRSNDKDRATIDILGIIRDEVKRPMGRIRETVKLSVEGAQDVRRKSVQYQTGFILPPGKYGLKVVLRENQDGAVGSFETTIVVPDLRKSPMKVSSVVLGTQLQAARRDTVNPLARDGSELVPSLTHVVSTRQPIYFYYEVYDPSAMQGDNIKLLTSIAFFRGRTRTYETPTVELTRVSAPDRKAAVFQFSVPAAALRPGFYTCQINIIDDVAGTFTFPRVPVLVRQ